MRLWICEKPDQARNIAAEIGVISKAKEYIETKEGIFTWGFGHMLEAVDPADYEAKYARWTFDDLPCIPKEFKYVARERVSAQLKAIGGLVKKATEIVIATDPDREGEMIGRELLDHFRYKGPVRRLWLNALDSASIRKAIANLRPGETTAPLYWAAKARSEADWLVGINLTRAATLTSARTKGGGVVSVGRVQTPTLALVVRRDRAIAGFTSSDYYELEGEFEAAGGGRVKLRHAPPADDRCLDLSVASNWCEAVRAGSPAPLTRKDAEQQTAPPALFSLSGLTKRTNALWGWSAEKTLGIAQSLYETHKATSYPRSDCVYLPEEQITDAKKIAGNLISIPAFSHLAGAEFAPRNTVFNSAKITAHHAIIPTTATPPLAQMSADERSAYLLIAAHYLACLLPNYRYRALRYATQAGGREFSANGTTPVFAGWKIAFTGLSGVTEEADAEKEDRLPDLPAGSQLRLLSVEVLAKKTKPPAAYTEGTLVEDMENAAKHVTDPAKRARLKETSGIGTQATRASIIETLKARGFISTKGKKILSTNAGQTLIGRLEKIAPALTDPGETAVWEDRLESIAEGKSDSSRFVLEVGVNVRELLGQFKQTAAPSSFVNGSPLPPANTTSVAGVLDRGDWFECEGVRGRLYKAQWGHTFTADEIGRLVGGETLVISDCKSKTGAALPLKKVFFDPKGKPWPGLVFKDVEAIVSSDGGNCGGDLPPISATTTKRSLF